MRWSARSRATSAGWQPSTTNATVGVRPSSPFGPTTATLGIDASPSSSRAKHARSWAATSAPRASMKSAAARTPASASKFAVPLSKRPTPWFDAGRTLYASTRSASAGIHPHHCCVRSVPLVGARNDGIAAERAHVERYVRCEVHGVDEHAGTGLVGQLREAATSGIMPAGSTRRSPPPSGCVRRAGHRRSPDRAGRCRGRSRRGRARHRGQPGGAPRAHVGVVVEPGTDDAITRLPVARNRAVNANVIVVMFGPNHTLGVGAPKKRAATSHVDATTRRWPRCSTRRRSSLCRRSPPNPASRRSRSRASGYLRGRRNGPSPTARRGTASGARPRPKSSLVHGRSTPLFLQLAAHSLPIDACALRRARGCPAGDGRAARAVPPRAVAVDVRA